MKKKIRKKNKFRYIQTAAAYKKTDKFFVDILPTIKPDDRCSFLENIAKMCGESLKSPFLTNFFTEDDLNYTSEKIKLFYEEVV
jgi:hypothetical protein